MQLFDKGTTFAQCPPSLRTVGESLSSADDVRKAQEIIDN